MWKYIRKKLAYIVKFEWVVLSSQEYITMDFGLTPLKNKKRVQESGNQLTEGVHMLNGLV